MIGYKQITEVLRQQDDLRLTPEDAEVSPLPALFTELGVDPDVAFHVAEQRALRMLAFTTGRDPLTLTREDLEQNKQFVQHQAAQFLDGLAAGLRLLHLSPEQKSMVNFSLLNVNLKYDGAGEDGSYSEDDEDEFTELAERFE